MVRFKLEDSLLQNPRHDLRHELKKASDTLPVQKASRAAREKQIDGGEDALPPLRGASHSLLHSINFDAEKFQSSVIPRSLRRGQLKAQS